jgi:3-oxoacyl-[acyl-carrier protein] reductase
MNLFLKDKVAVVMAASKGLGAATARVLAEEGARVVISARNAEELAATARQIAADTGATVLPVQADSSRAGDIARLIETAHNTFGRLDCLVVNAGGPPAGTFATFDDAAWHSAIELTLMSAVRAARLALPIMQAQKSGSITFIQSASIKSPIDNLLLSNSLRLGVAGMAKTLSREVAADGIRVNLLCPGSTETDRILSMARNNAERNGTTIEDEIRKSAAAVPLGRIAQPEEFGRVCAFIASPAASFVTGAAIMVDGGASRAF